MYNNWKDTKALSNKIVILTIVFYRFLSRHRVSFFLTEPGPRCLGKKLFWKLGPIELSASYFLNKKTKRYDYYRLKTVEENDVKLMGFTLIPCLLYKAARFYWKSICENRTFEFSFTKSLFCLYKTIEWD